MISRERQSDLWQQEQLWDSPDLELQDDLVGEVISALHTTHDYLREISRHPVGELERCERRIGSMALHGWLLRTPASNFRELALLRTNHVPTAASYALYQWEYRLEDKRRMDAVKGPERVNAVPRIEEGYIFSRIDADEVDIMHYIHLQNFAPAIDRDECRPLGGHAAGTYDADPHNMTDYGLYKVNLAIDVLLSGMER